MFLFAELPPQDLFSFKQLIKIHTCKHSQRQRFNYANIDYRVELNKIFSCEQIVTQQEYCLIYHFLFIYIWYIYLLLVSKEDI